MHDAQDRLRVAPTLRGQGRWSVRCTAGVVILGGRRVAQIAIRSRVGAADEQLAGRLATSSCPNLCLSDSLCCPWSSRRRESRLALRLGGATGSRASSISAGRGGHQFDLRLLRNQHRQCCYLYHRQRTPTSGRQRHPERNDSAAQRRQRNRVVPEGWC